MTLTITTESYVYLLTCAVIRAVHLKLTEDLSAETVITIFRRFVGKLSCPSVIISDSVTNFRAGADILLNLSQETVVQDEHHMFNLNLKFIPPRAPWHGSFYERMISLVKGSLKKCLYRRHITLCELQTLLAETETRITNCPLTYQTDQINNPHLLLLRTCCTEGC